MKLRLRLTNCYWRIVGWYHERRADRLEAKATTMREDLAVEQTIRLTEKKRLIREIEETEQENERLETANAFLRTLYEGGFTHEEITGGTQ